MSKKIVILGAGGHAGVLVDILRQNGLVVSASYSPNIDFLRTVFSDIPILKNEDEIFDNCHSSLEIVNGLGSLPGSGLRTKLYNKFSDKGYVFSQVISKHAIISAYVTLGKGVQIMPGAIIQAGAVIGDNTIINTGAVIEHDCRIGAHNHIAPGVTLSGQVKTGDYVHIGTGANVIQSVSIGDKAVISTGANVTKDVSAKATVFGAKAIIKKLRSDK